MTDKERERGRDRETKTETEKGEINGEGQPTAGEKTDRQTDRQGDRLTYPNDRQAER